MPVCAFVKPNGTRCKALPMRGEEWCYAHHPRLAEARSENGRKGGYRGGRGRGSSEVAAIKGELRKLVEGVRSGKIGRADAAVCGQLLNVNLRALEVESRQAVLSGRWMTPAEALAFVEILEQSLRRHVADRAVLDLIGQDLQEAAEPMRQRGGL